MHHQHVIGFTNMEVSSPHPLQWWVEAVRRIKREFPDRPLFASIMRTEDRTERDWVIAAQAFQKAGVDGLELNFSCSHAFHAKGGGASIGKDPEATRIISGWVVGAARVPAVAKLPVVTSDIGQIASIAVKAGIKGITAINSVPGVEGIDLETMTPCPTVNGLSSFTGYSGPAIKPVGLRCVGEIKRAVSIPLMGCGGIWDWKDAAEYLAMGAALVQLCTGPMFQGFDMVRGLIDGLSRFLERKEYPGVSDLIGLAFPKYVNHGELPRDYRVIAQFDLTKCKKCRQCYFACRDGANEAITIGPDGAPSVQPEQCIGCSLCQQVCRQTGCITMRQVQEPLRGERS
jgi:dihydropyrimidine dehydrogenase (NAD+) subunit PreA